jgi:hypothetical protein
MLIDHVVGILTSPAFWIFAAAGGFLILLFLVSLFERRYTMPYVPVRMEGGPPPQSWSGEVPAALPYFDNTPNSSELPEYVRIMSDDAYTAGFVFDRLLSHVKAPKVDVMLTVWMSPDARTIVLCGAGRVLKMPAFQTHLFSPLTDGRWLVTTDNNDAGDRSGLFVVKRVIHARFDKLMDAHRRRLDKFGAQVTTFPEPNPLAALTAIFSRQADRLVERGMARYSDPERLHWHFTAWGGLMNCVHFFTQLAQTLPQAWRVNRKPIGSHKVLPLGQSVYERYRAPGSPPLPRGDPGRVKGVPK